MNPLSVLQAKIHKGEINAVQNGGDIGLWHKRLGHINEKGPQLLAK